MNISVNPQNPMVEDSEEVIDLLRIFNSLLQHWFIILLVTVMFGGAFFAGSKFLITPQYASTSQLWVLSKSTSITSLADIQAGTNLTYDYIAVVTDRPILDRVIEELGLDINYKQLANKISVSNPSNSRLLNITVTDRDPVRAKEITDEIAEVVSDFIAEKMDQDPPSIISYGYSDGNPVSPNTRRNAVIGALIGMVLACVIIVIKALSHDVIETPADIETKLGLYMLAALPFEEDLTGKKGNRRKKKE